MSDVFFRDLASATPTCTWRSVPARTDVRRGPCSPAWTRRSRSTVPTGWWSTGTRTPRWPGRFLRSRCTCRWRTSRQACARSTDGCPRSTTGSSPTTLADLCLAPTEVAMGHLADEGPGRALRPRRRRHDRRTAPGAGPGRRTEPAVPAQVELAESPVPRRDAPPRREHRRPGAPRGCIVEGRSPASTRRRCCSPTPASRPRRRASASTSRRGVSSRPTRFPTPSWSGPSWRRAGVVTDSGGCRRRRSCCGCRARPSGPRPSGPRPLTSAGTSSFRSPPALADAMDRPAPRRDGCGSLRRRLRRRPSRRGDPEPHRLTRAQSQPSATAHDHAVCRWARPRRDPASRSGWLGRQAGQEVRPARGRRRDRYGPTRSWPRRRGPCAAPAPW